jgi:periplasmic protein CpxP/Spy
MALIKMRLGRFGRAGVLALCAVALCAVPMRAQDNSTPPQGQGGHGHWGGPGGMHGRGLGMLTKQLDLTPDQVTQIKGIFADEGTQMKALHEDTSTPQADKRQKMFSIHKDSHERFMAVLTPEQTTKFQAMEARMREHRGEHGHGNGQGGGTPPPPPQ